MADREAKIKFKAETAEFQSAIKNVNKEMSSLRSEMKLNESQFKNNGDKVEYLKSKQKNLESQLEQNKAKQDALNAQIEVANRVYGEDSDEVAKLQRQLNYAQTEENNLKSALSATTSELSRSQSASARLNDEIKEQEQELDRLTAEYKDAVLEQGKESAEAQKLEREIGELNGELQENRSKLKAADDAAEELTHEMDDLDNEVEKVDGGFTVFKGTLANLASQGISRVIDGVKEFAKDTLETGKTFEASMSQVAATMGVTTDEIQDLTAFAKEMGSTTAFTAAEAADALNYMALAGYDAETSMKMLPNVLNLAAAGNIDLADASDMVTDSQTALGLSLDETEALVDQMAQTASKSNTSVAQLGEAILTIGGTAKNMSGGITEMNTVLGVLADNGIKGSEAGTHLRNIILALSAPTDNASAKLAELGISASDSEGNMRPLNEVMADFNDAMADLSQEEKTQALNTIFNKTDLASVNALLDTNVERWDQLGTAIQGAGINASSFKEQFEALGGNLDEAKAKLEKLGITTEGFDMALNTSGGDAQLFSEMLWECCDSGVEYEDVLDAIGLTLDDVQTAFDDSKSAAEAMADTQLDNLQGDLTLMDSALDGVKNQLYEGISPVLRELVQFVTSSVTPALSWLISNLPTIGVFIGGIVAAIVAYQWTNILTFISGARTAIGGLFTTLAANPIGIVIAAITALIAIFVTLWNNCEEFRNFWIGLWNNIQTAISPFVDWVKSNVIDPAIAKFQELGTFLSELWDGIVAKIQEIWEKIRPIVEAGINAVKGVIDAVMPIISAFWDTQWSLICTVLETVWNVMSNIAQTAMGVIQGIIDTVMALISGDWEGVWKGISSIFQSIFNGIVNIGRTLFNAFSSMISTVLQGISNVWSNIWNAIKNVASNIWNAIKNTISNVINGIKSTISSVINAISSTWSNVWNTVRNVASNVWNGIRNTISNVINGIRNTVSSVVNGISSTISSVFNGVRNTVSSIWNGIKSAITSPIETAKNTVSNIVNKIKGFFNFRIRWPHIPLPHFAIRPSGWQIGDLLKGSIPSLGIDWYAKGGILTAPTIFGANGNTLLGGGEAGREAVLPINLLQNYIDASFAKHADSSSTDRIVGAIDKLADRGTVLEINGEAFAKTTQGDFDSVSGHRQSLVSRGLAL